MLVPFLCAPTLRDVVVVLAVVVGAASAEFQIQELNDKEFGIARGAGCPPIISFQSKKATVSASTVAINRKNCTGGSIVLNKNPSLGGNLLTTRLRNNTHRGTSYEGVIMAGNLTCPESSVALAEGTYFQLFEPDKNLTVNFASVYAAQGGSKSPLAMNSTADFTFLPGVDYLVIGSQCLYSRNSTKDGAMCFPSSATVYLESGETTTMAKLSIGDSVLVAKDTYSPVFLWTHADAAHTSTDYITISTSTTSLTLTAGHHVYLAGKSGHSVEARHVRVGDLVSTTSSFDGEPVTSIKRGVLASGLYNPQTLHGSIVVDDMVVSTYTSAVPPRIAHAALAPLRVAYRAFSAIGAAAGKTEL
jgi:Hint module